MKFEGGDKLSSWQVQWSEMKKKSDSNPNYALSVLEEGKKHGVPDTELKKYGEEILEQIKEDDDKITLQLYIIQELGIGTPEELEHLAQRVYDQHMKEGYYSGAAHIAEKTWGRNSQQYQDATKMKQEEFEPTHHVFKPYLILSSSATLDDLAKAFQQMQADPDSSGMDIDFLEELKVLLGEKEGEQLGHFLSGEVEDANLRGTRVEEFFKKHNVPEKMSKRVIGFKRKKVKGATKR